MITTADEAWKYVKAVVAGDIVACKYLKLACKKLLNEYEIKQHDDDYPWMFHDASANHFLNFASACRYPDGTVANKPVHLHPWQNFTFAMSYGWRSKSDIKKPRFNDIYTRVARKNDKTTGLTTVMLYELLTGPGGHEQYITAVDRNQASIAFRKASIIADMLKRDHGFNLGTSYGKLINKDTNSFLVARSRENKASDGASCYRGYWDEAARIEDEESFDILHSSQGAWKGSHQNFYISTAQANRETRYYQDMEVGRRTLEGNDETPDRLDRKLYVFYELDDDKEWTNPDMWIKSNPSINLSTDVDFLEARLNEAVVSPSKKSEFLRKYCNLYVASENPWLDVDLWNELAIEDVTMTGHCYIGIDMGKTSDLNAVTAVWCNRDLMKYEVKGWAFLPKEALERAPKHTLNVYQRAIERGSLIITPGHSIDEEYIDKFIRDICSTHDVKEIAFDPYKSQAMMTKMIDDGLPMVQQRQGRISMGPGIAETEKIILSKQLSHEGDPFLSWQIANCQVSYDTHDLPILEKPGDYAMKIDNATALVMAISRATVHGSLMPRKNYNIRMI